MTKVNAFNEPDDEILVLNELLNQCISEHAPIKQTKFTRPPASWLKYPEISKAENVLDNLRTKSRNLNHSELTVCQNYQTARNRFKNNKIEKSFFSAEGAKFSKPKRSMGGNSLYTRSTKKCINQNPERLNEYFAELASKLINKENVALDQTKLATIIPERESDCAFVIKHTTFNEVSKFISELRNDFSSSFDNIPVKLIRPVAEDITSPIVNIISSSIDKEIFPDSWKVARVCPFPKTLFNMQTTLVCTYQIPSEISNLQYQFSKLTLEILINGPKTMV